MIIIIFTYRYCLFVKRDCSSIS